MVQPIHPRPDTLSSMPLALVGAVERAIALATGDRCATVQLFKADWESVDVARQRIVAAGLESRVTARHVDALRLAGPAAARFRWTN